MGLRGDLSMLFESKLLKYFFYVSVKNVEFGSRMRYWRCEAEPSVYIRI
jgi:hypothetical protein